MTAKGPCGLCGTDPARGHAQAGDVWLCHPDDGQDCYHLWTVYGRRPEGTPDVDRGSRSRTILEQAAGWYGLDPDEEIVAADGDGHVTFTGTRRAQQAIAWLYEDGDMEAGD